MIMEQGLQVVGETERLRYIPVVQIHIDPEVTNPFEESQVVQTELEEQTEHP